MGNDLEIQAAAMLDDEKFALYCWQQKKVKKEKKTDTFWSWYASMVSKSAAGAAI